MDTHGHEPSELVPVNPEENAEREENTEPVLDETAKDTVLRQVSPDSALGICKQRRMYVFMTPNYFLVRSRRCQRPQFTRRYPVL